MNLGLIGHPVAHSLSPSMHRAALRAAELDAEYRLLDTPPAFLRARLQEVRREYRGVNVTIPHKQAVIPFLDELSPEARAIGAVNTVVNEAGRLLGHNTDAPGFIAGLDEAGIHYAGKRILVLGAGGAARAVGYALKAEGSQVAVYNRTPARAEALAGELGLSAVGAALLEAALANCDLLVNTTSVGLDDPNASPLPTGLLPRKGAVVDIVYRPAETKLLRDAAAAGLKTQGGLPMLVWQGAMAFEMWTGAKADVAGMYAAARQALAGERRV